MGSKPSVSRSADEENDIVEATSLPDDANRLGSLIDVSGPSTSVVSSPISLYSSNQSAFDTAPLQLHRVDGDESYDFVDPSRRMSTASTSSGCSLPKGEDSMASALTDHQPRLTILPHLDVPAWIQDDMQSQCYRCGIEFSLFVRRHHCRRCGKIYCGECSSKKVKIPRMAHKFEDNSVRVCNGCLQWCEKEIEIEKMLSFLCEGMRMEEERESSYSSTWRSVLLRVDERFNLRWVSSKARQSIGAKRESSVPLTSISTVADGPDKYTCVIRTTSDQTYHLRSLNGDVMKQFTDCLREVSRFLKIEQHFSSHKNRPGYPMDLPLSIAGGEATFSTSPSIGIFSLAEGGKSALLSSSVQRISS